MANLCGLWLAPAGSQRSAGPEEVADGRYQGVPWPWGIPQARWMVDPGKSHENLRAAAPAADPQGQEPGGGGGGRTEKQSNKAPSHSDFTGLHTLCFGLRQACGS